MSLKIVPGPTGTTTIYKPDGAVLATKTNGIFTELIEPQTLTRTGSYTVLVDPSSPSATGTVTVTAYDVPADTTGSISIDGSANVVIGTPGQNGTLTFSGTSGSRVSVKVTGSPTGTLYLKKPDGSTLSSVGIGSSSFMEPQTLPDTGTYTLLVDPTGANTGTAAVDLYSVVADVTDTITPGGSPVTVTISDPGQNASVTFSGTASQRVSMKLSSGAPSGTVYLKRASGTIVAQPPMGGTFGNFMEPVVLPATETYTLLVDPISAATGSVTLTLYDVAADITGSITAGGSSVNAVITSPGQVATYTFSATAGDRVSGLLASGAPAGTIEIRKTGSFLKSASGSSGAYIDVEALPSTGTYTFKFDPETWNVGTGVLTLYAVPAD